MWKTELDGTYYRVYDKRKNLVGYFAPDYGHIYPEEKAEEIIEQMNKRHEKITSGLLMIPMVKFGVFYENREMDLEYIARQIDDVKKRLEYWSEFLSSNKIRQYKITVSHTDHDMLSITMRLVFSMPVELEKDTIQTELAKILDHLQEMGLL